MAFLSDYRLILDGVTYYLHNQTGTPTIGGDMRSPTATPLMLAYDQDYLPQPPKADLVVGGDLSDLLGVRYAPVDDELALLVRAATPDQLAQILAALNGHSSLMTAPGVLWCQPRNASSPLLFAVARVEATLGALKGSAAPGEGGTDAALTVRVRRSAAGGVASLRTLLSASVGNSSVTAFGMLPGDLAQEGLPLSLQLAKPTSQSPTRVYVGSVSARATLPLTSTLTGVTSSSPFAASSSVSAAPLRSQAGVHLHVLARLTALTNPSAGRVRVRAESTSGAILWQGDWVDLGSATATQLLDLGGTPLDLLRLPTGGSPAIILRAELASATGASISATLDRLEALWCYDWCAIDLSAALATNQRVQALGVQQVPNGPYLPREPWDAVVSDTAGVPLAATTPRGTLPRALPQASLFVAWCDAGNAHTASDTAALTVQAAPLWRSIRPII